MPRHGGEREFKGVPISELCIIRPGPAPELEMDRDNVGSTNTSGTRGFGKLLDQVWFEG